MTERLAKLINQIETSMVRGELDKIDMVLKYIGDPFDDLISMENEVMVTWVRITYRQRHKLSHWIAARDKIEQTLTERGLDGKYILRGLYE